MSAAQDIAEPRARANRVRCAPTAPRRTRAIGAVPSAGELLGTLTRKIKSGALMTDAELKLLRENGVDLPASYMSLGGLLSTARKFAMSSERLAGLNGDRFVGRAFRIEDDDETGVVGLVYDYFEERVLDD